MVCVRLSQKISIFLDKGVRKNINFLLTKVFVWCSVVQCVAACCSVLQCLAVSCSALKCLPACFNALQCDAVSCSVLQCTHRKNWIVAVCCSVLQCVAVCSMASVHILNSMTLNSNSDEIEDVCLKADCAVLDVNFLSNLPKPAGVGDSSKACALQ